MALDPDPNIQIILDPTGGSGSTTLFHPLETFTDEFFLCLQILTFISFR
jgi:hypothetical protein